MTPGPRRFLISSLVHAVAVEAQHVRSIARDSQQTNDSTKPSLDVATLWCEERPCEARHVLMLDTPLGSCELRVGERVQFVEVPADVVRPLPALLCPLGEALAIRELVPLHDRFAYALDVAALVRLGEESRGTGDIRGGEE